jgi:predicted O-linked N-acetylglucosamine transferase (SPINDLY family)
MTDDQLFAKVQADEIDILVDLNGHTSGNRLTVFAMKPAPVQVSYLGYPNTTGLNTMDYRLTSRVADPEQSQACCTEQLCRLEKTFLCYRAPSAAPELSPSPALESGIVTFGSFNNLAKINLDVIELWAEILLSMPATRLLIKNPSLTDESTQERYLQHFTERGIEANRIDLLGFARTTAEHLATYGRIDIALDTFPYNGTTTTCEALWMGVPVVTLAGRGHRARVGASILTALNRAEWIADSPEALVSIVQSLVGDIPRLASLRAGLRDEMGASSLCDAKSLVREIESVYSRIWAAWRDKVGPSDSSNGNRGPMYSR